MRNVWVKIKCDFCGNKIIGAFSSYTKGDITKVIRACALCKKEESEVIKKWVDTYEEK